MTLIKENGTGMSTATSYADVADADDYHTGHIYATAWTGATSGTKIAVLMMATRLLDASYQFNGRKLTTVQSLQWPRMRCPDPDRSAEHVGILTQSRGTFFDENAVPPVLVRATCEFARELIKADTSDAVEGEGISQLNIAGGAHIQFAKRDKQPLVPATVQIMLLKLGVFLGDSSMVVGVTRV